MPVHPPWRHWVKPLAFVAVAAIASVLTFHFREDVLAAVIDAAERLKHWSGAHPMAAPLILIAAYVVTNAISIPSVITLSVIGGYLFGLWEGLLVASFGAAAGATAALVVSRLLLREAVTERWPHLVEHADEMIERDGAFYILSLRLIHVIPSWLVNLVVGCTTLSVSTFWWATQLGMLPAAAFYVHFGSHLSTLADLGEKGVSGIITLPIVGAFLLLSLLPMALRPLWHRWRDRPKDGKSPTGQ